MRRAATRRCRGPAPRGMLGPGPRRQGWLTVADPTPDRSWLESTGGLAGDRCVARGADGGVLAHFDRVSATARGTRPSGRYGSIGSPAVAAARAGSGCHPRPTCIRSPQGSGWAPANRTVCTTSPSKRRHRVGPAAVRRRGCLWAADRDGGRRTPGRVVPGLPLMMNEPTIAALLLRDVAVGAGEFRRGRDGPGGGSGDRGCRDHPPFRWRTRRRRPGRRQTGRRGRSRWCCTPEPGPLH